MKSQKNLLIVICYIVFFSAMNITMFNAALPNIARDFSLTPSQVSWMIAGYGMMIAIGSTTYGKLTELFPARRLLILGLIIYAAGSVVGLLAPNYSMVVVARLIQATGAAAIPAIGMIAVSKYIPAERRGYSLGWIASTVAMSTGLGPFLGGLITQYGSWRFMFLLSVLSLMAIPFLLRLLPSEKPAGQSFDKWGALLFLAGVATMLLGINANVIFFLLSILLFWLFAIQNRRSRHPFIQMSLFKNRTYRTLLFIGFITFAAMFAAFFTLPLMLEEVYHLKAGYIGLALLPGSLMATLLGGWLGKLSDRFGNQVMIRWATLAMAIGFFLISTFVGLSPLLIAGMFILVYLGYSGIQSGVTSFVSKVLSPQEIGIGMGLYSLSNFLGGAFGSALASRFIELDTGRWNLFTHNSSYSDVFLLLTLASFVSLLLIQSVQARDHQQVASQ